MTAARSPRQARRRTCSWRRRQAAAFFQAVLSGRSAGVPGAVAMLHLAQNEHGRLPWSPCSRDSERLARTASSSVPGSPTASAGHSPQAQTPDVSAYFTQADGHKSRPAIVLKNPAYAATLRRIAAEGPAALLAGPIAADIVAKLHEEPLPGTMTLADLAAYRAARSRRFAGPIASGGLRTARAVGRSRRPLEGLGLLEHTDIATRGPADPQGWFEFAQAERLMYADDCLRRRSGLRAGAGRRPARPGLSRRTGAADRTDAPGRRPRPAIRPARRATGPDATHRAGRHLLVHLVDAGATWSR